MGYLLIYPIYPKNPKYYLFVFSSSIKRPIRITNSFPFGYADLSYRLIALLPPSHGLFININIRVRRSPWKFILQGGKHLYIDEIHKYHGWSTEIKNIYDMMPDLKVVYSGSSILDLEKGGADLSRRKVEYTLLGLSFREYLNISQGWNLPRYSLEDILAGSVDFPYD